MNAKNYLEIGVSNGDNFNSVNIDNKVGVDPNVNTTYKLTSDDFFKQNNTNFDIIFIDGLHYESQVYTDIINALKILTPNGYIICHDVCPPSEISQMVPRLNTAHDWTGDCWKAWVRLRQEKTDMEMKVINCDYGCGIIKFGKQNAITVNGELTYSNLEHNKKEWLGLISVNDFLKERFDSFKPASKVEDITKAPILKYNNMHGGLWTDLETANVRLEGKILSGKIDSDLVDDLKFWIENGYVIFRNEISEPIVDNIIQDIKNLTNGNPLQIETEFWENGQKVKKIIESENDLMQKESKILGLHSTSSNAQKAIFSDKIIRFLDAIFERCPLAFQSLTFKYGSKQPAHQDTAFVKVSSPMEMAASWIALEDACENSGRLQFYPGSHKLEKLFSNNNKWHYGESLSTYSSDLCELAETHGLELKEFDAKKGDVLIWAADLIHQGSINRANDVTRLSMVTHYCPVDCYPHYFYNQESKIKEPCGPNAYISSAY